MVVTERIVVRTVGDGDMHDITGDVERSITKTGIKNGIATVFVAGSTAGVTTLEYEPGLVADLGKALERMAPKGAIYAHNARWGDNNGHSHVRASLVGPSLTVPFRDGKLLVGNWQQIVLIDFDNRPRTREVVLQILGE